jgi:hypothetical protein
MSFGHLTGMLRGTIPLKGNTGTYFGTQNAKLQDRKLQAAISSLGAWAAK